MSQTPAERALVAKIMAQARWSQCSDRAEATAPARRGLLKKFEDEVDPDRTLPDAERAYRAECARKAFYLKLALKSSVARRHAKEQITAAEAAETELAAGMSA